MQEISVTEGLNSAFDALIGNRLSVLIGAGLSMAPPSNLPSAANLSASAKQRHEAIYGLTEPPFPNTVEAQAEYFFARGQLDSIYFSKLIDPHAFSSPPNEGHFAVADFLLIKTIQTAITTNVDTLIENAGEHLFGSIGAALDGHGAAMLPASASPLLKVHGCRLQDRPNMVWAPSQLQAPPVSTRIENSATWLAQNLLNRDLLIVGYWTDWSYLNEVLDRTLGAVSPANVLVVDTAESNTFSTKAPNLYALGQRATLSFRHVKTSGATFLDDLRRKFSQSFIRQVLHAGLTEFNQLRGTPTNPTWTEPGITDNRTLWQIRRDLEGRLPNEPAKDKEPPIGETTLGLTLIDLQAGGATPEGAYWRLNNKLVRVLRASNKRLDQVAANFSREIPQAVSPDIVIAVGSEDFGLTQNVVRIEANATIARGSQSRWLTRIDAMQELGL